MALQIVLDVDPARWHNSARSDNDPLALPVFLSQLAVFLNAHLAAADSQPIAVFAALPAKSVVIYPTDTLLPDNPPLKALDELIVSRVLNELHSLDKDEPCAVVGALAKALCYINSTPKDKDTNSRILILSVSPDLSASYVPIMNCIFSAQKLKVTIDVCRLFGGETIFLQQAAHLTGGSYVQLERRDAVLQYLIMAFLPPPELRKTLLVPTQDKIDLRASCFCHKNVVDIGYVCSVCLSIFCQPIPVCSTCRAKFPIKTLQRLNATRATPISRASSLAPSPSPASPSSQPTRSANALPHSGSIKV